MPQVTFWIDSLSFWISSFAAMLTVMESKFFDMKMLLPALGVRFKWLIPWQDD
jgi:hypothetical protein